MMKRKISFIVLLSVIVFMFCSCNQSTAVTEDMSSEAVSAATNNGKGRYVENEIKTAEGISWYSHMYPQKDGKIQIFNYEKQNLLTSDSEIASFQESKPAFLEKLGDVDYISSIAFSLTNDCVMEYTVKEGQSASLKDSNISAESAETGETEDYYSGEESSFDPLYAYIGADGTVTPLSLNLGNAFISEFAFSSDGRLFGYDFLGKVYEIDTKTGDTKNLFTGNSSLCGFAVTKNYIIAMDMDNIYFYDLNTKQETQNPEALVNFFSQQKISREVTSSETKAYHFYEGEDNIFYILSTNGMYRFVMEGNRVEQLIDGSLCCISNPSYYINSFIQNEDGSFYILYSEGKLIHYTYDADVSSVPENVLRVYSLNDNASIRQTISEYQTQYPDMYVDYETGMSGTDGITYNDALVKLNTEIMAGNGPDIIVLDSLPITKYNEKGMLEDLTPYMNQIAASDSLLTNITQCFQENGTICAMPAKFRIPILVSDSKTLNQISDLSSLYETEKNLRKENTEHTILDLNTALNAVQMALIYEGNSIVEKDGKTINEEKLKQLLLLSKEIYDENISGVNVPQQDEKEIEDFYKSMGYDRNTLESAWALSDSEGLGILMSGQNISVGVISGFDYDFNITASIKKVNADIGYRFGLSDSSKTFIPSCILGMTASSTNKDAALQFMQIAFSEKVQSIEMQDGFSVNEAALKHFYDTADKDEGGGCLASSSSDNPEEVFTFNIFWPDQEQIGQFDKDIRTLDTPLYLDKVITDIIIDQGTKYVKGNNELDKTVSEIMDKSKLRLSE